MVLSGAMRAETRYELQWRLSRAMFFLGQDARARKDRAQLHRSGIEAGERAIALNDERVEGHFWTGVNLALFAQARPNLIGLRALFWARSELRLAIKLREGYHDAGPLRVLARLEHRAPRLLGGNRKLSRDLFERALEIAPNNSVTLLYAAEFAIDRGESERAGSLLRRILDLQIDPEWEYENTRDKEIAQRLLERLG
jgi:tetratricopeptide (TPR) repeat protein